MKWLALVALAACGGGGAGAGGGKAKPKLEGVDETKAEKGAKDLLTEIYEDINHADTDSLQPPLAVQLVVFGPRRADAFSTRSDAVAALKQIVDPKAKKKPELKSGALAVVPSPGGRSAWAVDQVDIDGQAMSFIAVLTNADDIWLLDAAAVAEVPSMKKVRKQLKQDAIVAPGMAGIAKIDPAAQGAVDRFKQGLAAQSMWGDDLVARTDSVVVGPAAGDVTRGKSDIKKAWKKRVKANTREAAAGEVTAAMTPDKQLAWVTAAVVRFADEEEPLPLRAFAVFEKSGSSWKMIALQESLAIDEPGAGLIYKKTAAPPVAKPVEEKPKDEPKPEKKKKKKKKKKPASDEE
jgi:ketosteroid isomerase-like protein